MFKPVKFGAGSKSRGGSKMFGSAPRPKSTAKMRRIASGYGDNWATVAAEVRIRDKFQCQKVWKGVKCLKHAYEVHHLIPAERGGKPVKSNLITICHECHERAPGHEHMRKRKTNKRKVK